MYVCVCVCDTSSIPSTSAWMWVPSMDSLQKSINLLGDATWWSSWCESFNRNTIFVNQKLCEIPLDSIAHESTLFLFQEFEQWCSTVTINIDLFEKITDLCISLLQMAHHFFAILFGHFVCKLIAWERQDLEIWNINHWILPCVKIETTKSGRKNTYINV